STHGSSRPIPLVPFMLVAGGVAAAGLAIGIGFGVRANSIHDELEAKPPAERSPARRDEGENVQLIANVGYVCAAAGAAIGGALLVIELSRSSERGNSGRAAPTVAIGWNSVSVRGEF